MKKKRVVKKERTSQNHNNFKNLLKSFVKSDMGVYIVLSVIFIILQVIIKWNDISHDFSAYYLSGVYLFGNSNYFEVQRPIVVPLIIGFLDALFNVLKLKSVFSLFVFRKIVSVVFVILTSFLFLFAIWKFSKKHHYNANILLFLCFTYYFILYSNLEGTELLTLSLLIFALSLDNFVLKYFILAIMFLTRFNVLIYIGLIIAYDILNLILSKDKRNAKYFKYLSAAIFTLIFIISIWALVNFFLFNHPFYPLYIQYFQNVAVRRIMPLSLNDLFYSTYKFLLIVISTVLFAITLIMLFYDLNYFKTITKSYLRTRKSLFFSFVLVFISVIIYYFTPTKILRYLFFYYAFLTFLIYHLVEFLFLLFSRFCSKNISKKVLFLIVFVTLVLFSDLNYLVRDIREWNAEKQLYFHGFEKLKDLNLSDAVFSSNAWVNLNFISDYLFLPFSSLNALNYTIALIYRFQNDEIYDYVKRNFEFEEKLYKLFYNDSRILVVGKKVPCDKITLITYRPLNCKKYLYNYYNIFTYEFKK